MQTLKASELSRTQALAETLRELTALLDQSSTTLRELTALLDQSSTTIAGLREENLRMRLTRPSSHARAA